MAKPKFVPYLPGFNAMRKMPGVAAAVDARAAQIQQQATSLGGGFYFYRVKPLDLNTRHIAVVEFPVAENRAAMKDSEWFNQLVHQKNRGTVALARAAAQNGAS